MHKILHVFSDSPYAVKFIEFINGRFNSEDHLFIVLISNPDSSYLVKYKQYSNCHITYSKNIGFNYFRSFKEARKVIIHQLNKPLMFAFFIIFYRSVFKKSVWVLWGGDVYFSDIKSGSLKDRLIELYRMYLIPKFQTIVSYIKGDYCVVKERYGSTANYLKADYPSSMNVESLAKLKTESSNSRKVIIVGNSADPSNQHLDILETLSRFKDEDIIIRPILSYGGGLDYIDEVVNYGHSLFNDKFQPVLNYMDFDAYLDLISSSDVCVFNHKRQQGLGNQKVFLALKKKLYINAITTPYTYFLKLGVKVNSVDSISSLSFDEFIYQSDDDAIKNREIALAELDEANIEDSWREVFK